MAEVKSTEVATVRLETKGGDRIAKYLDSVKSKLAKSVELRVGFLQDKVYPDGKSVPMIAAINEFGAPSRGQPPRPFFRRMIRKESPHWGEDAARELLGRNFDVEATLNAMGMQISGELQQSIIDLVSPPLKRSTVRRKGFSKPLIDTSVMLNSVDYNVKAK